jgi:Thymidylate synthase
LGHSVSPRARLQKRRPVSRCPVQYRFVLTAYDNGGAGGDFVHTFGDLHLYNNHLDQAREQLSHDCRSLPRMKVNSAVKNIHDFVFEDFELVAYDPHPSIKRPSPYKRFFLLANGAATRIKPRSTGTVHYRGEIQK